MLSYIQDDIYGCFTALCFTAGLSLPLKTGLTDWLYFTPGPSPTLSSTHTQATTTKQKHYVCIYTHTSTKLCFTKHHIFPNTSPHVSYMHTQAHKHTQKASPLLLRGPPPQKLRNVVLVSLDAHCFSFTHTDGPSSDRGFIQRCYYSWLTQKLSEK